MFEPLPYDPRFVQAHKIGVLKSRLLNLTGCMTDEQMANRLNGTDWPDMAYTMIGLKRLENIEYCINQVIEKNIEGAFIETGVWRGGACIFMAGLLKIKKVVRDIYLADIFDGTFPQPTNSNDQWVTKESFDNLRCSQEQVKENFKLFDLWDDNICFLNGWFSDTLPGLNKPLSLIRLDGDMYSSTYEAMLYLYPFLSKGGFVIIDDWFIEGSREAVKDYFKIKNINHIIIPIDDYGAYFVKT